MYVFYILFLSFSFSMSISILSILIIFLDSSFYTRIKYVLDSKITIQQKRIRFEEMNM